MIKLKVSTITAAGFMPAFTKLCQDPFTPGDKLRLAKTKRLLMEKLDDVADVRNGYVKEHGILQVDLLKKQIERLAELPQSPATDALKGMYERERADITAKGLEVYAIDPVDKVKGEAFKAAMKELLAQEADTALDNKLKLSTDDKHPSKLDANDLCEVLDLVEV